MLSRDSRRSFLDKRVFHSLQLVFPGVLHALVLLKTMKALFWLLETEGLRAWVFQKKAPIIPLAASKAEADHMIKMKLSFLGSSLEERGQATLFFVFFGVPKISWGCVFCFFYEFP